ncbi:hypothetical protein D3C75_1068290 [compost metagenome]
MHQMGWTDEDRRSNHLNGNVSGIVLPNKSECVPDFTPAPSPSLFFSIQHTFNARKGTLRSKYSLPV